MDDTADATPTGDPLLVPTQGDTGADTHDAGSADHAAPPAAGADSSPWRRFGPSRGALLAAVALIAVTIVAGIVISGPDDEPTSDNPIPLDAWMPYWTLDDVTESRMDRVGEMRDISPFWYGATGVEAIGLDPNVDVATADEFMELLRSSGAEVVPSIVDALPAGEMAAILADSDTRTRHVEAILEFAEEGDFDGIDLDYEQFAFADGSDTWATTRPNWVAFVEQLGDELHASGRTLTVSIPPVYDDGRTSNSGFWVYDHGAIAAHVDRIRIMAYDFSVGEPGPIAPLDFVQRSVDGALEAGVPAEQVVLGVPIYGRNWPTGVSGDCPEGTELDGVTSTNLRTIDDLVARRSGVPIFDPVTGESTFDYAIEFTDGETTCVQSRTVHYVDASGARLRMQIAVDEALGGASLWAFGFDDEQVWTELASVVDS
ncbi:glycosyl hydrolase family 18 protein [Ilumatobacter nonamiensis]|uniref:glycosyl hydrolase family 18 protein n=1 Tax=Ilumatobacter nonamiensis TaxID=467093 RepID=UPI00034DC32F|nr:glycosyl hydrolase family 18 protein [Ilumatobacter nonamiensis]